MEELIWFSMPGAVVKQEIAVVHNHEELFLTTLKKLR